jgi:hypothetical protein
MLLLIRVGIAGSRWEMTPAGTLLRESPTANGDRRPRCANRSRLYQFSTSGEVKKNTND